MAGDARLGRLAPLHLGLPGAARSAELRPGAGAKLLGRQTPMGQGGPVHLAVQDLDRAFAGGNRPRHRRAAGRVSIAIELRAMGGFTCGFCPTLKVALPAHTLGSAEIAEPYRNFFHSRVFIPTAAASTPVSTACIPQPELDGAPRSGVRG